MSFELLKVIAMVCQIMGTDSYAHSTHKLQMQCQQTLVTCVKTKAVVDANALASCVQAGGY